MSPKETIINKKVKDLICKGIRDHGVRGLAEKTGLSPAILSRYSKGKVGEPTETTLLKLSVFFGVPVAWLRGDFDADEIKRWDQILGVDEEAFKEGEIRYIVMAAKMATEEELAMLKKQAQEIVTRHHNKETANS